ncbi:hypothetical protein KC131_23735 [Pseudomonas sp. JQ170]|uniref:hypothetical protein n=1 Tax=unclassified Pseudomonas TaxID=196821 RepID=UPI002651B1C2|nr:MULTISPECIES: hypothetical protein [unclassified Pseudomonas]MDN7143666.1 hypothetical protein [Pseudomonas sp. JQ170]WRO74165.1 hypothetical protein U9R80_16715 [Pseudomonas sp. 170C]
MDIAKMIEDGDTLLQEALEAVCSYHEARDSSAPAAEVERLRQKSEMLLKELEELQLNAIGGFESLNH